MPTYTEVDYERDARQALDRNVNEALGNEPGVHVEKHLVCKRPRSR